MSDICRVLVRLCSSCSLSSSQGVWKAWSALSRFLFESWRVCCLKAVRSFSICVSIDSNVSVGSRVACSHATPFDKQFSCLRRYTASSACLCTPLPLPASVHRFLCLPLSVSLTESHLQQGWNLAVSEGCLRTLLHNSSQRTDGVVTLTTHVQIVLSLVRYTLHTHSDRWTITLLRYLHFPYHLARPLKLMSGMPWLPLQPTQCTPLQPCRGAFLGSEDTFETVASKSLTHRGLVFRFKLQFGLCCQ